MESLCWERRECPAVQIRVLRTPQLGRDTDGVVGGHGQQVVIEEPMDVTPEHDAVAHLVAVVTAEGGDVSGVKHSLDVGAGDSTRATDVEQLATKARLACPDSTHLLSEFPEVLAQSVHVQSVHVQGVHVQTGVLEDVPQPCVSG